MQKRTDLILGTIFLVFCMWVYILLRDFPPGTIQEGMGPGFLPGLLIIAIAILSLVLIAGGLINLKRGTAPLEKETQPPVFGPNLKIPGILIGIVSVYLICLEVFGFLITTPFFILSTMKVMGSNFKTAVLTGIILSVLIYLIFAVGLNVPLPTGYLIGD